MGVFGFWSGKLGVSSNGGASWSYVAAPAVLPELACPFPRECLLAGELKTSTHGTVFGVSATHDAGRLWVTRLRLTNELDELQLHTLACPVPSRCFLLVGKSLFDHLGLVTTFTVYRSTDGGASWTAYQLHSPSPGGNSGLIMCPTPTRCIADAGGSWWATTDGGASWARHVAPTGTSDNFVVIGQASCVSDSLCWAISEPPTLSKLSTMLESHDGGWSWSATAPLPPGFRPFHFSCAARLDCVVVGGVFAHGLFATGEIAVTTDGGRHWVVSRFPRLASSMLPRAVTLFG